MAGISTPNRVNPLIHEQVSREMAARNYKVIPVLPEELRVTGKPHCIFSVNPKAMQRAHWTGIRTFHPCENGKAYGPALMIDYIVEEPIPVDINQMEYRPWSGKQVALDIIGQGSHHAPSEDLSPYGIFVAQGGEPTEAAILMAMENGDTRKQDAIAADIRSGQLPTEKEILDARSRLKQTHMSMIQDADDAFAQGPNHYINITAEHRALCKMYGISKPWLNASQEMKVCPACGLQVPREAMIHAPKATCGYVFDEAAVKKAKLPGYEHIWQPEPTKGK